MRRSLSLVVLKTGFQGMSPLTATWPFARTGSELAVGR